MYHACPGSSGTDSLTGREYRAVNYEVELHVDRDHTEQDDVITTILYEPRGKSRPVTE